jgi:hypothetical protein
MSETIFTPISTIRNQLIADTTVYGLVGDRIYPSRVQTTGLVTPAISFTLLGGNLDDQNPYRETELQFAYISETAIDQCYDIYGAVNAVLDLNQWTANNVTFKVKESTSPLDATDDYDGKWLYVVSNTYSLYTIG